MASGTKNNPNRYSGAFTSPAYETLTNNTDYVAPCDGIFVIQGARAANYYCIGKVNTWVAMKIVNPNAGLSASETILSCAVKQGSTIQYSDDGSGHGFFFKYAN